MSPPLVDEALLSPEGPPLTRRRRFMPPPLAFKLAELALSNAAVFSFPLVFAVVCGRTLGIHDYGIVAFYSSLAAFLGMFVEFGFDWYGIREVAQNQGDPQRCHRVLFNITAARLLLSAGVFVVIWPALLWERGAVELPLMVASAAYMVGFAFDASWYLRALERTRLLLAINAGVRLLCIVVLVAVVTQVATMWSAMWVYALVSLLTSGITWWLLLHQGLARRAVVELRFIGALMKESWAIVLGNLNGSLLTHGGIALLGLIAEPAVVGAATLGLRVRAAAQGALLPLSQLGFVRLSGRAKESPLAAFALGRRLLIITLVLSVLVALGCMWAAPQISQIVFKSEVPLAVGFVMMLALTLPVQMVGNLFGLQSLVALGQERRYAAIQVAASVLFCAMLFGLASEFAYGWALLAAEAAVLVLSGLTLWRLRSLLLRA